MTRYSPTTGLPATYQAGPFDSAHLYLQWGGKLPGGEEWSCGLRMCKPGGADPAVNLGIPAGITTAITDWHTRGDSQIGAQALLSFVKLNTIGTNGKYALPASNETVLADIPGGGLASTMPNQVALGITLATGFTRGIAHSGRFYSPLPNIPVGADGRVTAAAVGHVHDSAAILRTNLNAAIAGFVVCVMSRKAGAPGHRAVTSFEIGRVLDTQRRRRRSLLERP